MTNPARTEHEPTQQDALPDRPFPPNLPVIVNARDILLPTLPSTDQFLRFIDAPLGLLNSLAPSPASASPAPLGRKKESMGGAVLRGIKDLQQLQKQTIAVLESVQGSLQEIQQVLRSPEATRGIEKQQNAAALLVKGFAREAVEQAQGAVLLLPANPEAHLLLSLSLAADQQFDASLAVARKGLALIDRRQHPLAIECGLLHALAALGSGRETLDRWAAIIDALPLPVLFEQLARIAACFPTESLGGGEAELDDLVNRRVARDEQHVAALDPAGRCDRLRHGERVDTHPDEIPAPALFAALDAARDHHLSNTHRAILAQIARRLQFVRSAGDVVRFLTECVIPLSNRGLDRSSGALARASVKRLLRFHADVMTLHRALTRLEMAGAEVARQEVAALLNHWHSACRQVARARRCIATSIGLLAGGILTLGYVLWFMNGGALYGRSTLLPGHVEALYLGPAMMVVGGLVGLLALFGRTCHIALPEGRSPLSREERACLNTAAVRESVRSALVIR